MATTQSEDPNERVEHPRHYNAHKSGIETIELIEHLPCNFANAVKYLWRCGLKATETPLRDLKSARWYTEREQQRIDLYDLENEKSKTDIVWRALARRVIAAESNQGTLADYLSGLLRLGHDFDAMFHTIDVAVAALPRPLFAKLPTPLEAAVDARDRLWMLLDNIDTLDDSCRDDDKSFRHHTRIEQKKRFHIFDPDPKKTTP